MSPLIFVAVLLLVCLLLLETDFSFLIFVIFILISEHYRCWEALLKEKLEIIECVVCLVVNYGVIQSWMKMGFLNCNSRLLESDLLKALLAGILYYPTSLALTFYQQWVIKQAFQFPLFIVLWHYFLKFFVAWFYRAIYACIYRKKRVLLQWSKYATAAGIAGVSASLDIGLSNWSFEYTSISLYGLVLFSLILLIVHFSVIQWANRRRSFSFFLQPLRYRWRNVYVCMDVSHAVGVFFVNYKSTQFSWTGFFLIQGASMCGGLRWAASQKLLQKEILGLSNPFDMIYHVQPWMVVGILPLFFAFEARDLALISTTAYGSKPSSVLRLSALVLIGGLLATLMEMFEYLLLLYTSSLTLSVCSVGKELVTLLLAYRYRNDRMSLMNAFGLAMCIFGTALHVTVRTKRFRDYNAPQLTRPTVVYTELRDRQYAALSEASSTDSEEF
ncbi:Solute carrier family 35 member C2 [Trichinella pseudospiralis]|uniref:Solute carrier family 35 member C2 n=1 Tax=Trichinella pseudospiralis TaxID=6337 RepID=A0A0V0XRG5_TRIPS|nr:Solute carrier family 35 member C2 [Trichinella pseudospiralis]